MKKIISLLLCIMIVASFAACGKKGSEPKKTEGTTKTESVQKNEEKKDADNSSSVDKKNNENQTSEAKTDVLSGETAKDLESKVEEFNTTTDPERKEELRKELEEILKQAEALTQEK